MDIEYYAKLRDDKVPIEDLGFKMLSMVIILYSL